MRRISFLLLTILLLTGCSDKKYQTFTANVPLYMSWEKLRSSFSVGEEQVLVKPGKMVSKDNYLYINEYQAGIHVFDLSDPANIVQLAFIDIPGNVDLAIRNNVLYADSFTDLLQVDISDPSAPELISREENLFEYVIPIWDYDYPLADIDEEKGVITGYNIEKYTREIHYHAPIWPVYYEYSLDGAMSSQTSGGSQGNSYGVGGSMARFLCYDDYLYVLESTFKLRSLNVSQQGKVVPGQEQYLWGNVETLFIAEDHLFVGTSQGLHILSLEEPSSPNKIATYQHITACDPVVVSGNRAYVTLRAGNLCGGNQNLLEVVDLSDMYNPRRIASYAMTEPYGLGIDEGTLFICEGEYGLKVYDASDDMSIKNHLLADFTDIHAWDVIPTGSTLLLSGDDGFYLYDYSDLQNISVLDSILVSHPEE